MEQVTGARPAWFVEYDEAPSRILAHHWPSIPNFGDVTSVDWAAVPPVDIITGGYPCQPFSHAGHRKGTHDARHLWPHILQALRTLRPTYAVFENVAGHRTLGFGTVLADLAEAGFDAEWTTLRASDVGAPHHRERLFILAYPHGQRPQAQQQPRRQASQIPGDHDSGRALARLSGVADLDLERRLRWGDAGAAIHQWTATAGDPPPVIADHVTYLHPDLFGTRFPEVRHGINPEFVEWMMGLPGGWVTGEQIGLTRNEQLKALGNGVCPQQAMAALTSMLEMEVA